jgi:hypothetical protein
MTGSDDDCEIVSSISELAAPPPPRRERVNLPELKKKNGKGSAFWEYELLTGEHGDFDISDKVFDEFGQVVRIKRGGRDVRFLALTTRDGDGNRVFQTFEQAETTLNTWGKSITNKLLQAANKANYGEASSEDEAAASAEGNSGIRSACGTGCPSACGSSGGRGGSSTVHRMA